MPANNLLHNLYRFFFSAIIGVFLLGQISQAEAPTLTRLYPSGGTTGTTQVVTASGKFPIWPVQVDCQPAGLTWKPLEKNGDFEVTIPAETKNCIHLVRFYDTEGSTVCKRFLVGHTPSSLEVEPNNLLKTATPVASLPLSIFGVLQKGGDVDAYRLSLTEGATVVATVDAQRWLKSPLDALLQLVDARGNVVAENIDTHELDPQVIYRVPKSGEYTLRVMGFPESPDSTISFVGNDNCQYRLTITTAPHLEAVLPLAVTANQASNLQLVGWNIPSDPITLAVNPAADITELQIQHPQTTGFITIPVVPHAVHTEPVAPDTASLALPSTWCGTITAAGETDTWRFSAEKDKSYRFRIESQTLGFPLDPVVRLLNSENKELQKSDDSDNKRDPIFNWKAPASGDFQLTIADAEGGGGSNFLYRVTAEPVAPRVVIKSTIDHIEGKPATPIEAVLTVERLDGFSEPLQAELVTDPSNPLPPELTLTSSLSEKEGDSSKQIKLTIQSSQALSRPLKVLVKSTANPQMTYPVTFGDENSSNLWLTVAPPK